MPKSTAALIWLRKPQIGGIADLKGKTIAIAGLPFERELLQSVLAGAGLTLDDVKVEFAGYELVPALLSGKADAIFGSWNVEGIELEKRGLRPVVTRVQDLGVPAYEELVLIARRDRLERDPESIRDFIAAMNRGTAAAIEDPKAAANLIASGTSDPNRPAIEAEVKATLPLLSRSGRMDPELATGLTDWMHEEGLIQRAIPASELLTDDYLPSS
jgi:putative hydroxymethylpyrimidine transport system substrate-binding protein